MILRGGPEGSDPMVLRGGPEGPTWTVQVPMVLREGPEGPGPMILRGDPESPGPMVLRGSPEGPGPMIQVPVLQVSDWSGLALVHSGSGRIGSVDRPVSSSFKEPPWSISWF